LLQRSEARVVDGRVFHLHIHLHYSAGAVEMRRSAMHLPAEQDESEPPVTGWTDTDGNGIRASSEEEEVDSGSDTVIECLYSSC
jgi:hypothetical protein